MNDGKMTVDVTDEELALQAASGCDEAVNRLIFRYAGAVRLRASVYYDADLAPEDLAQEGMIGLLSAIKGYSPDRGASFKTFAMLCIDRSIISAVRSTLKNTRIPSDVRVSLDSDDGTHSSEVSVFADGLSAEDIVLANETRHMFERSMSDLLNEREQQVLLLRLGGCTYDDIAVRLKIKRKTVDNILYKVRKKLKGVS